MKSEEKRKVLERRRLRAGRLLRKGVSKAEVARRLGVAPSTVTGWAQRLERGEPPRDSRRLFDLSQAAMADSSD